MIVTAGLLLVGQGRVHTFIPGAGALRPALLLGVLGLVLWLTSRDRMRSPARLLEDPVFKAALFVVVWASLGVPFSLSMGGSATYLIESFSRTFLVFLIVAGAVRNLDDVRRLLGAFALAATVFAVMAPVARITGGGAGGYDPNDSAMFMASGLPAIVFFVLYARSPYMKVGAAFAALGVITAIVETQSRGGFLALVAVLAAMLLMLKVLKPAVRLVIVLLVLGTAVPVASGEYWDRMQTITELDDGYGGELGIGGRLNTWKRGLEYTWANPVTGLGINQFPRREGVARAHLEFQAGAWRAAHSTWIQALAELGIPGFIAFVGMFLLSLRALWRSQRATFHPPPPWRAEEVRSMAGLLMVALIGAVVAGSFLSHAYSTLVWGMLALVVAFQKVGPGMYMRRAVASTERFRERPHEGRLPNGRAVTDVQVPTRRTTG